MKQVSISAAFRFQVEDNVTQEQIDTLVKALTSESFATFTDLEELASEHINGVGDCAAIDVNSEVQMVEADVWVNGDDVRVDDL